LLNKTLSSRPRVLSFSPVRDRALPVGPVIDRVDQGVQSWLRLRVDCWLWTTGAAWIRPGLTEFWMWGPTPTANRFHRYDRGRPRFPRSVIDTILEPSSDEEDRHYSQAILCNLQFYSNKTKILDWKGNPNPPKSFPEFSLLSVFYVAA